MRELRILAGIATIIGALAVAPAAAFAHEFILSNPGKIKDAGLSALKVVINGGTLECTKEISLGEITVGKAKSFGEEVEYSECRMLGVSAVIVPKRPKYELQSEGKISFESKMTIEVPGESCSIVIEPAKNKELSTVSYKNLAGGKLEVKEAVKGITYTSSGGPCGASGMNGELTGSSAVELEGGSIEWT
jgi:hypothetical protein